jgi:hypothetical protein
MVKIPPSKTIRQQPKRFRNEVEAGESCAADVPLRPTVGREEHDLLPPARDAGFVPIHTLKDLAVLRRKRETAIHGLASEIDSRDSSKL